MSDDLVTVEIDGELCIGIGQCEMLEAEVFQVQDDGRAIVIGSGQLPRDRADAAVVKCPSGAITIAGG